MKKYLFLTVIASILIGNIITVNAGGGNYNNYSSYFNRSNGALILVNSADTLGNSANRIPKIWTTSLDTTSITIGGTSAGNLDMGGYKITDVGQLFSTQLFATSTTATSSITFGLIANRLSAVSYIDTPFINATSSSATSTFYGNLFVSGNTNISAINATSIRIGTTSPWASLAIEGNSTLGNSALAGYFIGTSTATSTLTGGIESSVINLTSSTASSTMNNGINLFGGCFAMNGTCLVNSTYGNSNVISLIHSSTTIPKTYTANTFTNTNIFSGLVGIGTSTPWASLSIDGNSSLGNSAIAGYFIGTTTASSTLAGGIQATILNLTSSTASSTASNGINLIGGCFSVNGVCLVNSTYGDVNVNSYIHASTTIVKTYTNYLEETFTIATSAAAWAGTSTLPVGAPFGSETIIGAKCFTDTGTLDVAFGDGTNEMYIVTASTTVGENTFIANNTFNSSEKRYFKAGTPASSPTVITCTIKKIKN